MSYFGLLGLDREPFSTSPDPDFFYQTHEYRAALTRLMIEIRLRRGLSVILGDIGVGKTTLSRKLFQMVKEREDILFYIILDPTSSTEELFIESLLRTFHITLPLKSPTLLETKESLKDFLFQHAVDEGKTVALLIDEAQKLTPAGLEVLRVLLNYETNEFKMLQLILLGQMELLPLLKAMKNFANRISLKYVLNPLDENEMRQMINFRLKKAGYQGRQSLFGEDALSEIFRVTKGYPRDVTMLCHDALKDLVMSKEGVVTREMILRIASEKSELVFNVR